MDFKKSQKPIPQPRVAFMIKLPVISMSRIHDILNDLKSRITFSDQLSSFNLKDQKGKGWEERADAAAGYLSELNINTSAPIRIGDFGCGNKKLLKYIDKKIIFEYKGFDLLPQSSDVQKCDFKTEVPNENFDVVFCLGMLEYLDDIPGFLNKVSQKTNNLILSYIHYEQIISEKDYEQTIKEKGWKYLSPSTEMEDNFTKLGFQVKNKKLINNNKTVLWCLHKSI
jgi:hypothetical protein